MNTIANIAENIKLDSGFWNIKSNLPVSYTVEIVPHLFDVSNLTLSQLCKGDKSTDSRVVVFIDKDVDKLYGDKIKNYLKVSGIDSAWYLISGDEVSKNIDNVLYVAKKISESGLLRRSEKILAIGGGVLMDVVGFTANLYRRGVPYIRIPTTLMGQIDAGIGIKTGINYLQHKNRLGTYYAPEAALIDPEFLSTLSQRHIANGVAEIIKMACIKDKYLFELIDTHFHRLTNIDFSEFSEIHQEIMGRAIDGMLRELEPNLWENELERVVDYGHTFSPSLELKADPTLLHGEAVAVDMALCTGLALSRGLITEEEGDRCIRLIQKCKLPIQHPVFTISLLEDALKDTIKHRDGFQRVPLMASIGNAVFINDLCYDDLMSAFKYVKQFSLTE
ncbi:sedoheptulose 7-phosphate cyclase [Klebsiella sp. S69]|uniref:sedoheptulose 7-phosphate cyclase n=1 Tax=Klebsiella sp. S69 TaxID=2767439 RepID=UPI001904EC3B|nr:sedoheptulose 7-phosphate cyclase [Klebsiella sp. S69]MBK0166640.1 sedoheptulose 7-phosphate cyclase [Klebsiella sp. S69]